MVMTKIDYDDELFGLDIELDEFAKRFREKFNRDPLSFEIPEHIKFNEDRMQHFKKVYESRKRFIENITLPVFRVIIKRIDSDNEEVYIVKAANIQDACRMVQENSYSTLNDNEIKKVEVFPVQEFLA